MTVPRRAPSAQCLPGRDKFVAQSFPSNELLSARYGHAVAATRDKIYVFGGCGKDSSLNDLMVADKGKALRGAIDWELSESGNKPWPATRSGHTMVVYNDTCLILFGGFCTSALRNSAQPDRNDCWCYLTQKDTWYQIRMKGPTPAGRRGHSAVVLNDGMYIHGGLSPTAGVLKDTWRLDLSSVHRGQASWREVDPKISSDADVPLPRARHCAAVYLNFMYVFGGETEPGFDSNDLVFYSFGSRKWNNILEESGTRPSPRMSHAAAIVGDKWIIHGGFTNSTVSSEIHSFHFPTATWSSLTTDLLVPEVPLHGIPPVELPALQGHSATSLSTDFVLLLGGRTFDQFRVNKAWLVGIGGGRTYQSGRTANPSRSRSVVEGHGHHPMVQSPAGSSAQNTSADRKPPLPRHTNSLITERESRCWRTASGTSSPATDGQCSKCGCASNCEQLQLKVKDLLELERACTHPLTADIVRGALKILRSEERKTACVICQDAVLEMAFDPCGHVACCRECATRLVERGTGVCPMCRQNVKQALKVHYV